MTALQSIHVAPGDVIRFNYTNYKLETEWRTAVVDRFWFGSSSYHQGEQWFIRGLDCERNEYRNFALRDMRYVSIYRGESRSDPPAPAGETGDGPIHDHDLPPDAGG